MALVRRTWCGLFFCLDECSGLSQLNLAMLFYDEVYTSLVSEAPLQARIRAGVPG